MAAIEVKDPVTGQSGNLPQEVVKGVSGSGFTLAATDNGNDSLGLDSQAARALNRDLFVNPISQKIVQMKYASAPLTNILRQLSAERIKSMEHGYAVTDEPTIQGRVKTAISLDSDNMGKKVPKPFMLEVEGDILLRVGDMIKFKGIAGYLPNGTRSEYNELSGRISFRRNLGQYDVQLLNGGAGISEIPAGTEFFMISSMASEGEASQTSRGGIPEIYEQYMQKFLGKIAVSNIYLDSEKRVNWDLAQISADEFRRFEEEIERAYIFGNKSLIFDPIKQEKIYSMSGAIEQMAAGGSAFIPINSSTLTFDDIIAATNDTFVGNSGSQTRYMFMGSGFNRNFWKIKDVQKNAHPTDLNHAFGYNLQSIAVCGYEIVCVNHPLFDLLGYKNRALVLDLQNAYRKEFSPVQEIKRDELKEGTFDGVSVTIKEISSLLLTYPQTHALWEFK